MKKQIIASVILSAAVYLTGCGVNINLAAEQQTDISAVTTIAPATTAVTTPAAVSTETAAVFTAAVTETSSAPLTDMTTTAETTAVSTTAPAAKKPDITVSDSVTKAAYQDPENQLYFVYDCTLPFFECSNADTATSDNINELNEQMRQIMIAPIREQESRNYHEVDYDAADQAIMDNPIGNERISVTYQMVYQGNACTIMVDSYWYGGGAHGGNTLNTYLIDTQQMKLIRNLDDISAAPGEFSSFAAEYLLTKYADKYAGQEDWNADYLKRCMNGEAAWDFENDTFFLVFPEYALGACYADGRPCLEIPLADCLPHLSDYGRKLLQS